MGAFLYICQSDFHFSSQAKSKKMTQLQLYVQWFVRNVEEHVEKVSFSSDKTIAEFSEYVQSCIINSHTTEEKVVIFWGKTDMTDFLHLPLTDFFADNNVLLFKFPESTTYGIETAKAVGFELDDQLSPRWEKRLHYVESIYLVKKFMSRYECRDFINISESVGYGPILTDYNARSNDRVMIESKELATSFFERVCMLTLIPKYINHDSSKWKLHSINPRFRFCRYSQGQHFSKHVDAIFCQSNHIKSFFTLNVYLNEDFGQGETRFYLDASNLSKITHSIKPKMGMAVIFDHQTKSYLHDGNSVQRGTKYLLRTDIMYTKD